MTRTSTNPYTFTATQQVAGLFFPRLWFDNDGYVTAFSAKDSTTGLDIDPERIASYYNNSTTVDGLAYYKNTMGTATPAARQSKVGAFRPSDGTFYLDYNGSGTWEGCGTDHCLQIGMNGDIPLVGDWNGSGTSKVGAFRPTDGTFYLDYDGSGTWDGCGTDRCLSIGMNGDTPLVGKW